MWFWESSYSQSMWFGNERCCRFEPFMFSVRYTYWAPPQKRPYHDEVGADPGRLRIAFTTKAWNFHDVDSECVDAVAEAAKLCESLGHHLEEASPEFDEIARGKAVVIIADSQTRVLLK